MHKKIISSAKLSSKECPAPGQDRRDQPIPFQLNLDALTLYLIVQENVSADISRLKNILKTSEVILEIGCGSGNIARKIAWENPGIGVIATDLYDWSAPDQDGSNYQKTALAWKKRQLDIQRDSPDNLVLLRADANILCHLPEDCVDTIFLVNPEPKVGQAFMEFLRDPGMYRKIKPGAKQIVILPFSREMGVSSCGGYEFDHCEDWSRGLGFMMSSGFDFRKGDSVQWRVDLAKSSSYSSNSTQKDVFVFGYHAQPADPGEKSTGPISNLKAFLRNAKHFFNF
jgi:SAM-dependent methyltransferase